MDSSPPRSETAEVAEREGMLNISSGRNSSTVDFLQRTLIVVELRPWRGGARMWNRRAMRNEPSPSNLLRI